jgi:ADP-heptose:LPS heptosyltransferase
VDLHANLRTLILRALWPAQARAYAKRSLTRRLFLATRHPLFAARLARENVPQRYSLALESEAPDASVLRPRIFLDQEETSRARNLLTSLGLTRPIAVHPYATHPAKSPAPDVWRRAVIALEEKGEEILVLGRNPAPLLPDSPRDLTNATDLRTTAAIISQCRCLISGDSGPMHLATGVGTPAVALFGPTTAEWGFYPSGPHDIVHQIPCEKAPCSLHGQDACALDNACMKGVTASLLLELLDSLEPIN